ncbi:uncharacterized protein E5676_scaffold236G00020 [Cucumis melo var. makuwa]|nr:uncharacterized protein E5676_scaffold236G00020 [Cucumis melo var. makuwa]
MFDCFPQKLDNKFSIERLKALGTATFAGTTNPIDAEKWLSFIEKYFGGRRRMPHSWEEFKKAFKNKFYPCFFYDAKRNEFMSLLMSQTSASSFEAGLQTEISALVTTNVDCQSFSTLRGDERRYETGCQALGVQQRGNFKTCSHDPSSSKIIFVLKARTLMKKGHTTYLAHMVDTREAGHVIFLKLQFLKKACIFKGTSILEGGWLQELRSLLALWRILSIPSKG